MPRAAFGAGPGVVDFVLLGYRQCAAEAIRRGYDALLDDGSPVRFADSTLIV